MAATSASPLQISRLSHPAEHPYVIVTPPFTEASAGIRALFWLCDALNQAGASAHVAVDASLSPPGADPEAGLLAGLQAPPLQPGDLAAFKDRGLTPIVIYPETQTKLRFHGVTVLYALNYLGLLGGSDLTPVPDLIVAYSRNIQRRTSGCADVLFLPASDMRFWTPGAGQRRRGDLVYAGKYVDFHRQRLPLHLDHATRIYRHGPKAQTRPEIRTLLRTAKRLYVFENTAIAAEAALCGCPVVASLNWFFEELIAAEELGLAGFSYDDDQGSVAESERTVDHFRSSYDRTIENFNADLASFVNKTQALAASTAPAFL